MTDGSSRSYARRFSANVAFGVAGRIGQWALSFFLIAYVIRHLTPERFSLVVTGTTVVAFISLIQLGASAGLAKQLSAAHTRGDRHLVTRYYSAGMLLAQALAALTAAGILVALHLFWHRLNIPTAQQREGRLVVAAIGWAAICSCLRLPSQAAQQAAHRIDVIEKLNLLGLAIRGAGTVTLFHLITPSPALYATALAAEGTVLLAGSHTCTRLLIPDARLAFSKATLRDCRDVARFNLLTLFDNLTYLVFMQAPVLMLQVRTGLQFTGLYGIGLQLNNFLRGFTLPVANALLPITMSMEAKHQSSELRDVFTLATKCFLAAGMIIWVNAAFLSEPFLRLWLHRDLPALVDALPWLLAASAAGVAAIPAGLVAIALRRLRLSAAAGLGLAVAMVAAMFLAVRRDGAPPLTVVTILLLVFFGAYQAIRVLIIARALRVRPAVVADIAWRSLAVCIPSALLLTSLRGRWTPNGWPEFVAVGLLSGCISIVSVYAVLLRRGERVRFRSLFRRSHGRPSQENAAVEQGSSASVPNGAPQ